MSGAELTGVTRSAEATRAVGRAVASVVEVGDVVVLAGDLGAGKTTFAQGFAAGLGVVEPVTSPTFALVRQYRCIPADARCAVRMVLHMDLYRLDRLAEVADLGLAELVDDQAVALVEWGDVAVAALGDERLTVSLQPGSTSDDRIVAVTANGTSWPDRLPRLRGALASVWSGAAGAGGRSRQSNAEVGDRAEVDR